MDLVKIDVIHGEAPQRVLACRDNVLAAKPALVAPRTHRIEDFGGDNQLVAPPHLPQIAAREALALAVRVVVGGVEKIDAAFDCTGVMLACLLRLEDPRQPFAAAVTHASEADSGYGESGLAQLDVLHSASAFGNCTIA